MLSFHSSLKSQNRMVVGKVKDAGIQSEHCRKYLLNCCAEFMFQYACASDFFVCFYCILIQMIMMNEKKSMGRSMNVWPCIVQFRTQSQLSRMIIILHLHIKQNIPWHSCCSARGTHCHMSVNKTELGGTYDILKINYRTFELHKALLKSYVTVDFFLCIT